MWGPIYKFIARKMQSRKYSNFKYTNVLVLQKLNMLRCQKTYNRYWKKTSKNSARYRNNSI